MSDAVIVAFARTPFARFGSGAFNLSHGATLGGPALRAAVERAGIEPGEVAEVLVGCARPEGATGANIARQIALRAGLPEQVGGLVVSRGAASGLEAIALAAQRIAAGDAEVLAAGGVECPSCVQREANTHLLREPWLARHHPALHLPLPQTAGRIALQHGITRERLDLWAADSRRRSAAAQREGRFADEIVPLVVSAGLVDPSGALRTRELEVAADELQGGADDFRDFDGFAAEDPPAGDLIAPAHLGAPADGAAACVLMDARRAERRGLRPWARCVGFASAGAGPDESGLGAALAVRKLLQRLGLGAGDIDLWELHEMSAVHLLLCADRLELPAQQLNVDGGALALGSPDGAGGVRLVGHGLIEARRRGARRLCVAMEAGSGIGVAGVFELF